jgi:RHS repeat-associated protein
MLIVWCLAFAAVSVLLAGISDAKATGRVEKNQSSGVRTVSHGRRALPVDFNALTPLLGAASRTMRPVRAGAAASVVTGTITAGGAPLVVTIPNAGDTAAITFSGTTGDRVSLDVYNNSVSYSYLSIQNPVSPPNLIDPGLLIGSRFYEPMTLGQTGTYTIVIDPQNNTGSLTLALYTVPADLSGPITPGGTPVVAQTTAPGQNAAYTFTVANGQRVSLAARTGTLTSPSNPNGGGGEFVGIANAGTGLIVSNSFGWIDTQTLAPGNYSVSVDPLGDAYGQTTLTLYDVPPDLTSPTLQVNGLAPTITLGTPGQNASLPFHGNDGQTINLAWSQNSITLGQFQILDPNGNVLRTTGIAEGGSANFTTTLPHITSDSYKVVVNPYVDYTGSVTLALTAPLAQGQDYACGEAGVFGLKLAKCASAMLNDPVNSLTGAFENQVTDVSPPGTGIPFQFTRSYTSADTTVGPLGQGWTDSLAASLAIQGNGDVIVHAEDGQQVYFTKQPDGSYTGAAGALATLSVVGGGYQLARNDQATDSFDSQGRLTSIKDRNNQGLTLTYNGSGQLSTVTDAASRQVTFSYTGNLLSQLSLPGGRTVSYSYTNGLLTSVADLNGKVTHYTYDASNRLATIVDPLGHTLVQNTYGADGRVSQQKDAFNHVTTLAWDPGTQTETVTDARNNVWKDVYQNGVLFKRIDAQSNTTQFGFDSSLNETSVTGPDGKQVTLGYDTKGNLTSANSAALNATKTLTYNGRNDVATVTDPRGKLTSYGYDSNGNPASVTVDGQTVAQTTYNAQGQLTKSTDGNGKDTLYTYDGNGNLASVTDPLGNKTTYTYDAAGNQLTRVDPLGNVQGGNPDAHKWTYTYDNAGHMLTETNPLGKTTSYTYDDAGNLKTVTDANNHTTSYDYDAQNRLIKITAPDNGVTQYTYDEVGNRLTETDPLNHTTTSTYDADNRLASVNSPLGEKATYFYDANGNLAKQVDPRGNVQGANPDDYATTFTYDAAGRLLTQTDPLGHATTYGYDKVGNQTSVTDANNHTTSSAYDAQNRLTQITAPDNSLTQYTYDGNGNQLTRKDANNHTTTYTFDTANQQTSVTSPTGQKWTYTYDANGNLNSTVDANGNSTPTAGDGMTTYGYDAANRLTSITYSDSTPGVSLSYDPVGNRSQMTDGGGSQTYAYDAANRLTGVTRGTNTFSYVYNLAGNLTSRTYPDSTVTTHGYDNDERLQSATSAGQATTYSYDAASNLIQTALPSGNGYVESRTYDKSGRLTEVKNANGTSTLSDFAYTLDPVGNPTTVVRSGATSSTTTYSYDNLDRLTGVCFQAGTCPGSSDPFIRWTYDPIGNRLTEARSSGTTTYTYNAADQMTNAGSTTYTYDQNGNEKSVGSRTFSYNLANRLISTTSASTTTSYTYDGDGNRLQASTGSQASKKTNYLWDVNGGLPQLALERDGNNALLRRYIYGARRISMTTGGNTYYYHYDNLGSVTNITTSTGASEWTDAYEPFGTIRTETKNDPNAPTNVIKFTGEYLDPTGLYYMRARQYDPSIGRFLAADPLAVSSSVAYTTAYGYVADRPTVLIDPTGMTGVPSDESETGALAVTSPADESGDSADPRLSRTQLKNARLIYTLARDAGLTRQRAREVVAASYKESLLGKLGTNPDTGAAGLFQLLPNGPYYARVKKLGGVNNHRANTCAILWNYVDYWTVHPHLAAGQCASTVEASGKSASHYAGPLAWLPKSFKLVAVKPCPYKKPICAKYFTGTQFAYPNCDQTGTG